MRWLLYLLMVGISPAGADDGEILDLSADNEWIYVGGIKASIDAKTGECRTETEFVPEPVHPACLPDPFDTLCSINAPQVRERWKQEHERSLALTKNLNDAFVRHQPEVDAKLGSFLNHPSDPAFFEMWRAELDRRIRDEITKPEASRVAANVKKAFGFYAQMLRESRLPANVLATLLPFLEGCAQNPTLKLADTEDGLTFEATASYNARARTYGWSIDYAAADANRKVVKIKPAGPNRCNLLLNGQMWLDCAEGTSTCFQLLFHEFAHYMNSCTLRSMVLTGENFFTWTQKNLTYPAIPVTTAVLRHSYDVIKGRVECLSEVSGPHNGRDDAGERIDPDSGLNPERCLGGALYPQQWSEAEADFWSASANAVYLRDLPPPERRRVFGESIAMWCSQVLEQDLLPQSQYAATLRQGLANAQPPLLPSMGIPAPGVPAVKRKNVPKPWNDSHQTWWWRVNRNMLRNADLRDALGCTTSKRRSELTDIPVTCSPKGFQRRLVP